MSGVRRRVGVGDRILVGGTPNVVVSVSGTRVRLANDQGVVWGNAHCAFSMSAKEARALNEAGCR